MRQGFYLIDKPAGWTSFDVCAKLRKILNIKKIGHTGTLDPFATGLLVVAAGKCTRLIPHLEKARKTYQTEIRLGQTSETLDPESDVIPCAFEGEPPSRQSVETVLLEKFSGKIQQVPPQYSAIKVAGKRSYELARKGEKVDLDSRSTEIFRTEILSYTYPSLRVELEVAAGFYVRSFARDLGKAVAGGGMCQSLRRTKIGELSVEDAETLETLGMPIDPKFILTDMLQVEIPTGRVQDFIAGRAFPFSGTENQKVLVLCGGQTFGVGEFICGKLQPRVVL